MSWIQVENNCKALYQYQFIKGKDQAKRKIMIKIIADEFPEYARIRIAVAVDKCISSSNEPISPNTFLAFVKAYLRYR